MQELMTLSLKDIAPPNIATDEQVSSLIEALDPQLQQISRASLEPLIMARIDELPEQVLDLLAWQLHADFYDLAGTLDMKRKAVKGSILWHMHKGTEWAILEALRQIDVSAEFVAWWEDNSDPYTFKLKAIVTGDFYRTQGKDKLQASIRRAVEESKAARSYLAGLETSIEFREDVSLYTATLPVMGGEKFMRLGAPASPEQSMLYVGNASALQGQIRLLLPHEPDIHTKLYAAPITLQTQDISLGVDLEEMQELLRRFEERILSRIDKYEENIRLDLERKQKELNLQLEEIKEMLRWAGDDEPLDDEE